MAGGQAGAFPVWVAGSGVSRRVVGVFRRLWACGWRVQACPGVKVACLAACPGVFWRKSGVCVWRVLAWRVLACFGVFA